MPIPIRYHVPAIDGAHSDTQSGHATEAADVVCEICEHGLGLDVDAVAVLRVHHSETTVRYYHASCYDTKASAMPFELEQE